MIQPRRSLPHNIANMNDQDIVDKIKDAYKAAYIDVSLGRNLEKHLQDAKSAIAEVENRIRDCKLGD